MYNILRLAAQILNFQETRYSMEPVKDTFERFFQKYVNKITCKCFQEHIVVSSLCILKYASLMAVRNSYDI
jgi:hypothetical protein